MRQTESTVWVCEPAGEWAGSEYHSQHQFWLPCTRGPAHRERFLTCTASAPCNPASTVKHTVSKCSVLLVLCHSWPCFLLIFSAQCKDRHSWTGLHTLTTQHLQERCQGVHTLLSDPFLFQSAHNLHMKCQDPLCQGLPFHGNGTILTC